MKQGSLKATGLRTLFIVMIAIILVASFVGFYIVQTKLSNYANSVSHIVADAEASKSSLQSLQNLEIELEKRKDVSEKATSIIAKSQGYEYQDQVIQELTEYANKTGVSISQFDFSSQESSTSTESSSTDTSGLRSTSVTVTLVTPTSYDNLLKFVRAIENNLTRMQLDSINVSQSGDSSGVSVGALTIKVYIQ